MGGWCTSGWHGVLQFDCSQNPFLLQMRLRQTAGSDCWRGGLDRTPFSPSHIHTAKYRRCGLAFSKRFLTGKGARPVLYVPMGAKTQPMAKYEDVGEDWDELADLLPLEIDPAFEGTIRSGDQVSPEIGEGPATRIADWIEDDLLAFVKFFDPTLPEDHIDNYYMEREWRTVRNIQFRLSDVAGVYVAPGYATRLVTMSTDLAGKIAEL